MNANLFNQLISAAVGEAMREGVAKGKMSSIDVVGILNNHVGGILQIINAAQAQAMNADKQAAEIILPWQGRKPSDGGLI